MRPRRRSGSGGPRACNSYNFVCMHPTRIGRDRHLRQTVPDRRLQAVAAGLRSSSDMTTLSLILSFTLPWFRWKPTTSSSLCRLLSRRSSSSCSVIGGMSPPPHPRSQQRTLPAAEQPVKTEKNAAGQMSPTIRLFINSSRSGSPEGSRRLRREGCSFTDKYGRISMSQVSGPEDAEHARRQSRRLCPNSRRVRHVVTVAAVDTGQAARRTGHPHLLWFDSDANAVTNKASYVGGVVEGPPDSTNSPAPKGLG